MESASFFHKEARCLVGRTIKNEPEGFFFNALFFD